MTTFTSYNQSSFGLPTGVDAGSLYVSVFAESSWWERVSSVLSGLPTQPAKALKPVTSERGWPPRGGAGHSHKYSVPWAPGEERDTRWAQTVCSPGASRLLSLPDWRGLDGQEARGTADCTWCVALCVLSPSFEGWKVASLAESKTEEGLVQSCPLKSTCEETKGRALTGLIKQGAAPAPEQLVSRAPPPAPGSPAPVQALPSLSHTLLQPWHGAQRQLLRAPFTLFLHCFRPASLGF